MPAGGEARRQARQAAATLVRPARKMYASGLRRYRKISPHDTMFAWSAPKQYFATGRSARTCITECLGAADKPTPGRILDFGCGYGRVLRFLTTAFPAATITASEVDRNAVDFCARTFGAVGAYSSNDPDAINFDDNFDLIWAGSVFTHVDRDAWNGLLKVLGGALTGDGVLVFSTHGPHVEERLRRGETDYGLEPAAIDSVLQGYTEDGFGYADYPGMENAAFRHVDRYGITVVHPDAVRSVLDAAGLQMFHYIPTGWGNHQDVFACSRRGGSCDATATTTSGEP